MTTEVLFLEPVFKERIWGGSRLNSDFGFDIPSDTTGECWAISAHKNGATTIKNGEFSGISLKDLWVNHRELFGQSYFSMTREFPLMVKILDAKADLSVQVHPNDAYAKKYENDSGKAECWYILNATNDAKIVYGHTAKNIEEFKNLSLTNHWDKLLTSVKVHAGEFFDVPTGTVHAIGAGALILEVQQSSDITYRLYDYGRTDDNGNPRELHLEKSFAVIKAPHKSCNNDVEVVSLGKESTLTLLTSNKYFEVQKLFVKGHLCFMNNAKYLLVCAIDGDAVINGYKVKKGDSFIVPNKTRDLDIMGEISLIITKEAN